MSVAIDRYQEICAAYRWDVPPRFNIADACCGRWANDRARFALYWEDESGATAALSLMGSPQPRESRLECARRARRGRGDKVALILPQRPETIIAHLAVYQLGAIAVPLSFLFGHDALEYRLNDSGAKVAFVDPQSLPNFAPIRERCPGISP
jgi:acetyl-CoA synthetase